MLPRNPAVKPGTKAFTRYRAEAFRAPSRPSASLAIGRSVFSLVSVPRQMGLAALPAAFILTTSKTYIPLFRQHFQMTKLILRAVDLRTEHNFACQRCSIPSGFWIRPARRSCKIGEGAGDEVYAGIGRKENA
jgi:hypothetical protein